MKHVPGAVNYQTENAHIYLFLQNMSVALNITWGFSPDLIGVSEADRVGKGGVPELGDWGAELLVLVRKQHTKQRREQSQEFIVVRQSSAGLQAAENLTKKLLQLQEAKGESRQFLFKKLQVKIFKNCSQLTMNTPFPEAVRWIWAARWLLVCRIGWKVESEKSGLPWQCWRERGWWREQTGWTPGPILWLQRKLQSPPDKPLDTVPAGTGRWTDSPGPYFSFSSSSLECEELEQTKWTKWIIQLTLVWRLK